MAEEHVAITDFATALTGYHKFPGGTTGSRPAANGKARRIYINTTKMQVDVENLTTTSFPEGSPSWFGGGIPIFPTGTALVFYQAAPPTGWTAVAINDMALRVVTSGTTGGTTGGSTAFSVAWPASVTGSESTHTHDGTAAGTTSQENEGGLGGDQLTKTTNLVEHRHTFSANFTTGGGTSHLHTTPSYAPKYADVVIATKD